MRVLILFMTISLYWFSQLDNTDTDLDSKVIEWQKSNVNHLESFMGENEDDRISKYLKFIDKASVIKTSNNGEGYRKSLLKFLLNKFDLQKREFIIIETFMSENSNLTVFIENKKLNLNLEKEWEVFQRKRCSFNNSRVEIMSFSRDNSCKPKYYSNLISYFSKDGIITKYDDRNCQFLNLCQD